MSRAILNMLSVLLVGLTLGATVSEAGGRSRDLADATLFLGGAVRSPAEILQGPPRQTTFGREDIVHCVYWEYRPGGTNPKFGCFLAAANDSYLRGGSLNFVGDRIVRGDFYDTGGVLREGARLHIVKAHFVDAAGGVISAYQPRLLKIKYNDTNVVRARPGADIHALVAGRRQPPYRKARDMYTEVAATRLFWALGYPVQPADSTAAVVCHGCPEENAFRQKGRRRTMVYTDAMVDQKYPAGEELSAWSVRDVLARIRRREWPAHKRLYFDGLVVLAGLIHHKSNARKQNSLVCVSGSGRECEAGSETIMLIADLGSTFGAPHAKGQHSSWIQHPVWEDATSCRVYLKWKDMAGANPHLRVTQQGRRFILDRIAALTDEHLRAVFRSAHFEWVDGQLRLQKYLELFPRLAAGEPVPRDLLHKPGLKDRDFEKLFPVLKRLESRLAPAQRDKLDAAVIDQWVASFRAKVERLETEVATCGTPAPGRVARRR